jgi:hypothetical protein
VVVPVDEVCFRGVSDSEIDRLVGGVDFVIDGEDGCVDIESLLAASAKLIEFI